MNTLKRIFLSFLLATAVLSSLPAQEIGLQLYSLRHQLEIDVAGTLDQVQAWGITEVEGGGTYGIPLEEFKGMLKDRNIHVVSVGADFEQLRKDPMSAVAQAKAFGAKYVVCFWIPHEGDKFTLEHVRDAVSVFNAAGKILSEHGLSLCYHPHGFEFRPYESETLFDYLVTNADPANLNFEMDVFWVKQAGQDPLALLNKYPRRFLLLHLKDRRPGTPDSQNGQADVESNVVLGTGDVGIAEIMKTARRIGVKHYFIEDESSRSVEQIPLSLEFLRNPK